MMGGRLGESCKACEVPKIIKVINCREETQDARPRAENDKRGEERLCSQSPTAA